MVGECSPYPELPGGKERQGIEEDKGVRTGVGAALLRARSWAGSLGELTGSPGDALEITD